MAFEMRSLARPRVRHNDDNDDNPLTYQLQLDGQKQTPTSATIDIYAPGETTKTVNGASMTVSGTLMTYSVDTTTTANFPVDEGYRAEINITVSGTVYIRKMMFDVVKYILDLPLVRDQMLNRDDEVLAGDHGGNEDLRGILVSTHDELELRLEREAFSEEQMRAKMVLDEQKYATVAALYALGMYFRSKDRENKAEHYEEKFEDLWDAFLGSIGYDRSDSGFEAESPDVRPRVKLVL